MRKVLAMKTQTAKNSSTRRIWAEGPSIRALRANAFTLVELLVVIAVIALLVTIIMPSLNGAKVLARKARVTTLIKTISGGLEMFRNDQSLGDAYPPSYWDTDEGGNPYSGAGQDSSKAHPTKVYGAQMLVWGLAGADLLGPPPPGFESINSNNQIQNYYNLTTGTPNTAREGPFIDTSKATIQNLTTSGSNQNIYVGSTEANPNIPAIIDDFGRPVLYYAATDANTGMNKYAYNDNLPFYKTWTGNKKTDDWIANTGTVTFGDGKSLTGFNGFIHNPAITSSAQPMNPKSYLLISAGPDGLFGTQDDITNFPITGNNLLP